MNERDKMASEKLNGNINLWGSHGKTCEKQVTYSDMVIY
jgi:hypothetical protein